MTFSSSTTTYIDPTSPIVKELDRLAEYLFELPESTSTSDDDRNIYASLIIFLGKSRSRVGIDYGFDQKLVEFLLWFKHITVGHTLRSDELSDFYKSLNERFSVFTNES